MRSPLWIQEHRHDGWWCRAGLGWLDGHRTLDDAVAHLRELRSEVETAPHEDREHTSLVTVVWLNGLFDHLMV